jgi:predicted amidohydrolase
MPLRVAAAQLDCLPGDLDANVRTMERAIADAAQARCDLVVLPELADVGYDLSLVVRAARSWDEGAVPALRRAAAEHGIAIVAGVAEREGEVVYDSAVALNADGSVAGRYRKLHLFSPSGEDAVFARGDARATLSLRGWTCRLAICYDLRFPEAFRDLHQPPADLLLVCSAWPRVRAPHWNALLAARAIENQAFVVAANRTGTDADLTFAGQSQIVSPLGETIARASPDNYALLHADLDRSAIAQARSAIPVHRDARPERY